MGMFCYQCEQTAGGTGCTKIGVCGKDEETAALQDLLVYAAKGISQYAHLARQNGSSDHGIDMFVIEALFTSVTNVNFDPQKIEDIILKASDVLTQAKQLSGSEQLEGPAAWTPAADRAGLLAQAQGCYRIAFSFLTDPELAPGLSALDHRSNG